MSVIVPVYNEVAHLDDLLRAVHDSPVKKEIIIVDDGSTDGTREKLQGLPPQSDVTIVFHEKNCGKGASIRTALEYARGEYVLIQDSDLEYDPAGLSRVAHSPPERLGNVVYGVRPDRPERGLRFFLGAKFLTHLTNLLYRAGNSRRSHLLQSLPSLSLWESKLECQRFEFCPEVTAKLCRLGEKIEEVPILTILVLPIEGKEDPSLRRMACDLDSDPIPFRTRSSLFENEFGVDRSHPSP